MVISPTSKDIKNCSIQKLSKFEKSGVKLQRLKEEKKRLLIQVTEGSKYTYW